ncbi:MAG TPA: biopolymer transporter ExbD [Candidatus Hydrothermia bacterium]|nr:biopolymer transporter ExbD [Candidatus Hydrothermae bacterium]MDD3648841.1 biopolymer transporter ExbD [Candidatus Hydrothermia bacterium]MDD5572341.1 biopolymer transporter ExbD [Candidatus Hydrothermia bacterium]HOK23345.1 biopolymer transporter ExbD [Candidatus Hydrothermia bacterium]HOL24155.1 biopolymer transporter ExbD [Candidatus Hydrothermia bacterium]
MPILSKRKVPQEAEIPTASMADIAFLLIIFFMTSTVFMREKGLKIALPEKTDQVVKIGGERVIRVSINDVGEIFLDEDPVATFELKEKLAQRIADYKAQHEGRDPLVVLRTNVDAPYEKMIEVFDVIKQVPEAKAVSLASIRTGG